MAYRFEYQEPYQNFVNTIKSKASLKVYSILINKYFEFIGVDTETCDTLLKKDKKIIESDITSFLVYLRKKEKKKYQATKNYLNAITHFYHVNYDEELKWSRIKMYLGDDDDEGDSYNASEEDRPYTMDEIRTLYIAAQDMRVKFLIPLLTSTGMRSGAVIQLKLGDLKPINKYQIYQIKIYVRSKKSSYVTFCSPEARREIDRYLEYRRKSGERLTPKSPLLRDLFNRSDSTRVHKPRHLYEDAVHKIIRVVLTRDTVLRGEGTEHELVGNRYPVKTAHGFRKFFITTTAMNGMHPDWVDLLTGHTLPGVRGAYFKPTPEQLLEGTDTVKGYKDIIDSVTINEENKLRRENTQLKKELDFTDREIIFMKNSIRTMATKMGLDLDKLDVEFIEKHPG